MPSAKTVKTTIQKAKNSSINLDRPIVLPIEMVSRSEASHRHAEAYLLMNTRKRSYVVGCTSRGHPEYLKVIELVAKLIKDEKIKMVSEARKVVDKYVSGDIAFTNMTMMEGGRREDHGGYEEEGGSMEGGREDHGGYEEGGRKGGAWREEGRTTSTSASSSPPSSSPSP